MSKFIVQPGTEAIAVGSAAGWEGQNFRLIRTSQMNSFDDSEVIINPITLKCTHRAPGAQSRGVSYAKNGYFGFLRNGGSHCMIVPADKVFMERPASLGERAA